METKDRAKFGGRWGIEVFEGISDKRFKSGVRKGNLISKSECHNVITDEMLDHILNVIFHGASAVGTWYCALFEDNFTPDGDETYAVPGYTECTAYSEEIRPAYVEAAASSQSITNSANKATFTASGSKTLYGAALVSVATKGDTAGGGVLGCAGKFETAQPVIAGNVVTLTYTISAADDGV